MGAMDELVYTGFGLTLRTCGRARACTQPPPLYFFFSHPAGTDSLFTVVCTGGGWGGDRASSAGRQETPDASQA